MLAEPTEPTDPLEAAELHDKRLVLGAALWVVQQSGEYNMIMGAGDALTGAMCVAAIWGRSKEVNWLNGLGNTQMIDEYVQSYAGAYTPENAKAWEGLASSAPFGSDYIRAALSRRGIFEFSNAATAFEEFCKKNSLDWASAFLALAEEVCYDAGREARDVSKLRSLRGVMRADHLKAAGAQLIALRPLVTAWPSHKGLS
jgi:hypothetical protein